MLQRGWDAGVERVMITAGMLPEAREALELAEKMDADKGRGGSTHTFGPLVHSSVHSLVRWSIHSSTRAPTLNPWHRRGVHGQIICWCGM